MQQVLWTVAPRHSTTLSVWRPSAVVHGAWSRDLCFALCLSARGGGPSRSCRLESRVLPGLVHLDGDPQGAQALRSFQIFQLKVLKPWGQIPCCLHIRKILLVLERLLRLGVDNHQGARLRQAFMGAADAGLVNALFDDFV